VTSPRTHETRERERVAGPGATRKLGAGPAGNNLLVNTGWGDAHAAPHAPVRRDDDDAPCCGVAAAVLE
jgi:hypothetical protein